MVECSILNVKIHVEVPLLLSFFSFLLSESVYTNLIIFRTCYLVLGYNKTECALLGTSSDPNTAQLEKLVEPHAAVISMVRSMTEQCFCVLLCFFIGPWSDKFGRKPVLIIVSIGFTLTSLLISIFSYFESINPWYFMICHVPLMMTGGGAAYITVILSYITDVTSEVNRGLRMGIFEAVLATGILLGSLSSSYVFYATNYASVFAIAAGCNFLGTIFIIFFIPESLNTRETQGRFKKFFATSNISEMVKAAIKPRENYNRPLILLCVLLLTLYIFAIMGDSALVFLYLREKFGWTLRKYTLFSSMHSVAWILGTLMGVYLLNKVLRITESVLILVGCLSVFNGTLVQGLATKDWHIYAAGIVRCLGGVISPMVRSLVSKLVPVEEIGKIFSVIITCESLFGLLGSPIYTAIYNATINKNPSIFNFFTAGVYFVCILITINIIALQIKKPVTIQYNQIPENVINEDASEEVVIIS